MANRNSTSLVIPGNPLGSVLREVARDARRSTRDQNALRYATDDDVAALQSEVDTLKATNVSLQSQITVLQGLVPLGHGLILSDGAGLLTFTYPKPNPFPAPAIPVIQATAAVNADATVTVHTTTQTFCTLGVRHADTGAAFPAVYVFCTAFASTFVP